MAMISLNPKWAGKRAISVTNDKARKIKQTLLDMPGDLEESKLDFLKCVERIYFSDGTTFPEQAKNPPPNEHLTNTGILQGKAMAYGRDE